MADLELENFNKDNIDSAILNGIENVSIQKYLFGILESPDIDFEQFKRKIDIIVDMREKDSGEFVSYDNNYESDYMKAKGKKIVGAMTYGISQKGVIGCLQSVGDVKLGEALSVINDIKSVSMNYVNENNLEHQKVKVLKDS